MKNQPLSQNVMVSQKSVESDDPYDIVYSNITVVNVLFQEYLKQEEIAPDALRSYYVDYYLAQINNGGFSQFVYNSRWNEQVVNFVREGLRAMNAKQHLALFERGAQLIAGLNENVLSEYFSSEYFGDNVVRDSLNEINNSFYEISETEDLIALNSAWLRNLPGLIVLPIPEMEKEIARYAAVIPNREERIAEARALEPEYMKLIRTLCREAGHELDRVTAGDPTHVQNATRTLAWHFLTDRGHFYMIEANGKAQMYNAETRKIIAECVAPANE